MEAQRSFEAHRSAHAGFEDAVRVIDVDFDAEDEVLAVVGGLDIAGEEFALGCDLLDRAGEVLGEAFDADVGVLIEADAGEARFRNPDLDPELRSFLHGDDDLIGGDEIARTDTDDFDDGVGGGDEFCFAEASVEFGDVTLRLGEPTAGCVNVLATKTLAREDGGGFGLMEAGFGGVEIFRARAGLQKSEMLAGGFGSLASGIAFVAGVVELLAGDDVAGDELLHAVEVALGVDGVGLRSGVVGLGLVKFFGAGAVARFFECGGFGVC